MSFWSNADVLRRFDLLDREIVGLRLQVDSLHYRLHNFIRGDFTAMSQDLTALQNAVTADTDATNSALTLIQGIASQLKSAGSDPTKLQALVDQLNTNASALAAAVAANTAPSPDSAIPASTP